MGDYWYYDFISRKGLRERWQKGLVIAVGVIPLAGLLIIVNQTEHENRSKLLTKILDDWKTPEKFRPHIRRAWEEKTRCDLIPGVVGMSKEETKPFIEECQAVQSRLEELERHPQ